VRIFLQQGTPNPGASSIYFVVGDADELFAFHQANGVEVVRPPTDHYYQLRDYASAICTGTTSVSAIVCRVPLQPANAANAPRRPELKKQHGIDDDSHASHRFVERCAAAAQLHTKCCRPLTRAVRRPYSPGFPGLPSHWVTWLTDGPQNGEETNAARAST
jgi:hypothetical protein